MARSTTSAGAKSRPRALAQLDLQVKEKLARLVEACEGVPCYALLLGAASIGPRLVDDVFEELHRNYQNGNGKLIVVVHSGGGDIDAAYNLAQIFRRVGHQGLEFIVPRWAKSAATLLVCAGDRILMLLPAELGPLDPIITQMNPLEGRIERFSPLHIDSTLELIREEYKSGNKEMADRLMDRLQWPLTLGSFRKSLDIGKQYLEKLLSTRMLKDSPKLAEQVATKLTTGYADHGFCINLEEAQAIGLKAEPAPGHQVELAWEIYKLDRRRQDIEQAQRNKELLERLKDLPPGLIEPLPQPIAPATPTKGKQAGQ